MSDVLGALTPIGAEAVVPEPPPPPPLAGITAQSQSTQRRQRGYRTFRQISHGNPHALERDLAKRLKSDKAYDPVLTPTECQQQASTIANIAFQEIRDLAPAGMSAATARKNLAAMWGIAQDKMLVLQVRQAAPTSAPDLRPGLRELVRRLAGLETTSQEQPPTAAGVGGR